MKENDEKLKNGKAIVEQIQAMQGEYQVSQIDEQEEEMEFIDRLNRLIQAILGDSSFSVYKNLSNESLKKWHDTRLTRYISQAFQNNFRNTLYLLLLITITGFLVSEALPFYALSGVITTKVYVKSILTEVCFIFLSGYRATGLLNKVWVGTLRAGIFSLMLFVITSNTFTVGTTKIGNTTAIQEQVVIIEAQIKEKEKTIQFYMDKNWGVNVRQHTFDKNKLVEELLNLKKQQAAGANKLVTKVEEYKTYGRALFRVLLLLISALITRRIFKF